MLLPLVTVVTTGTVFVSVYLAAFHAPAPRDLPVAVVGTPQQARQIAADLDRSMADGFQVRRFATEGDARDALKNRSIYAAYVTGTGSSAEMLYAGANGPSVTATAGDAFADVASARGDALGRKDVVPAPAGDTRSMSVFYASFGVVLSGFLFGTATYQTAPRLRFRWRMASLGLFGAIAGTMVALLTGSLGFDALPGPSLGIAGVVALLGAAAGGATMALTRLLGPAIGTPVASVLLLTLGNSTSGGSMPPYYLPTWLNPLSDILPVGAAVRAVQGMSHFESDGLVPGIINLTLWTVVCAAVVYVREARSPQEGRSPSPRRTPSAVSP
ncbi:ABC transporter permease [Streptomyces subrutilus]|uniref:ABC transporter permease n=1 Tax=Streptomyces subrutilus TaxID=36818 RepID=UPI0033C68F2B